MMESTVSLIANVALALSFVVGLIFGIIQVRVAARDRRERLTLETLRNFQTRDFAELLYKYRATKIPATGEEFETFPAEDQIIFIQLSQEMESLGMLVAEKYIDLDLVDKTLGSFVTSAWEKYEPMFLDMRRKLPDPFLGEYFQWLAGRIEERMKNHPRPPFFEK